MAEKFCNQFGSGPHHLKIGKSFEKKNGNSVFHSIRYDFTPLSVDEERMGKLEVQENSGVSVSLPHNDGVNATNYKGQAKPASTKDCILIIDHETGELTLERLSNQILLKKTRAEKPEKSHGGMGFQLPSDGSSGSANPYLVKPEPDKPPASAYQVKREPDKPRMGSGGIRPLTPASKQRPAPAPAPVSPVHSNRNSPARPGPGAKGLSESSDSNSSSSSDSDSDSDSNASTNEKNCPLEAAMKAESNTASSTFSMPGDVSDLFLPGGGSHLPIARPHKLHQKPEKTKINISPSQSKSSGGEAGGSSMPSLFTDLGDDLQLTDESDTE